MVPGLQIVSLAPTLAARTARGIFIALTLTFDTVQIRSNVPPQIHDTECRDIGSDS